MTSRLLSSRSSEPPTKRIRKGWARRSILLTGATGFVGGELLARLLQRDERSIVCPVRADSPTGAAQRGRDALERALGREPSSRETARVEWVHADLESPRLGVDTDRYRALTREVDEIYHCAASTRFDLPLDEAVRINVSGVRALHALAVRAAREHDFRRFHHVSTAFVSGTSRGSVRAGHLPVDRPRSFRNTYEQSKARAERFLRSDDRVPTTIYRPSIVVGDSRTGRTLNWNVVYPTIRMIASGLLPFFPTAADNPLDCVPVDFVANGILALGTRPDTVGQTLYLTAGREALSIAEFIEWAHEGRERWRGAAPGRRTRPIGRLEWWALRRRASRPGQSSLRRLVTAVQAVEPYANVRCRFDSDREHQLLNAAGVRMPARADFFRRTVDYAFENNFGARPDEEREMPAQSELTMQSNAKDRSRLGYQMGLLTLARCSTVARMLPCLLRSDLRSLPRVATIMIGSALGFPLRVLEALRFGRAIDRAELAEPPIFILGHWRSGTTHLHNLMSQDRSFGYLPMHQAMVPDGSLAGGSWLRSLLDRLTPNRRPMDNMDFSVDQPQEEEIPLTKISPHSFYWQFVFPRRARELFERCVLFRGAGDRVRREWRAAYARLLRIGSLHAGGKRLILKNPVNTARIPELLAMYPEAKFVFIHRTPYRVFPSTRNLHRKIQDFAAVQTVSEEELEENIFHFYEETLRKYLADRSSIPAGNLVEVRFEDLERAPIDELRRVYASLGLHGFEAAEPAIRAYVESKSGYRKNSFELSDRERNRIEERCGFAFDEWGYERAPSRPRANDSGPPKAQRDELPQSVARFRSEYRQETISRSYTGAGHLALITSVALGVIVGAALRLDRVTAAEWLTVPLALLFANLVEYWGHRIPMHRRVPGLGRVFHRHTALHHRFFTSTTIGCESIRDFQIILFPPVMQLFFLGAIAAPVVLIGFALAGVNVGCLLAITTVGYYLIYEWLHLAHHMPKDSWVARLPWMARLREHHRLHHAPQLMGKWNYNHTFPIGDLIFGTLYREARSWRRSAVPARRPVRC